MLIHVGKNRQWGTWGYRGNQSWGDIIEECARDAEGAFECRPDTVLRWDGRELKRER